MRKSLGIAAVLLATIGLYGSWGCAQDEAIVYFIRDGETVPVHLSEFPEISGTVAYQGPTMDDGSENWKGGHSYTGVPILSIVEELGGLVDGETIGVVAIDGWHKILPRSVVYEETLAGEAVLATSIDGTAEWDDAPMLVFLPEDGRFSNNDMLSAFGPALAHYFGDVPSTTGMMVKAVTYLVVDYEGEPLPLPETVAEETDAEALLTVVRGEETRTYTIADLEEMDVMTAPGTFTKSTGTDETATYTGVPMTTLIGNVPADTTIRVTALDGYSMNYEAGMLSSRSEGTWILAFLDDDGPLGEGVGPFRVVMVGEENPHFSSSLSARMVERIEVLGIYEEYSLLLTGAVERLFARGELEAGIGCPCHTSTVTVTSKGETHKYTGLPLWRLVGYADDGLFPAEELGIHYDDGDFSDALAAAPYSITLVASDGYTQAVTSDLIARDDRFIVAFKMDGLFLDPAASGYMRFVYDDSVGLPDGLNLKSVKFLAEITLDL